MKRILPAVLCALFALSVAAHAAARPNIIFLLADDLGYGDLGCFGHPIIKSPHLDGLAADGMKLTDCHAASPNCSPSRTGILTGRSPCRVGMYDFARFKPMHIPASELTVAEVVRGAGYQTMFAGNWHCSGDFENQPNPGDHGFEHWLAHPKNFGRNPTGFYRNGEAQPKLNGWMSEMLANMLPQAEIGINDARPPAGVSIMDFIKQSELGHFTQYDLKDDISETKELSQSRVEEFNSMRSRMIQLHSEICAEGTRYDLGAGRKAK